LTRFWSPQSPTKVSKERPSFRLKKQKIDGECPGRIVPVGASRRVQVRTSDSGLIHKHIVEHTFAKRFIPWTKQPRVIQTVNQSPTNMNKAKLLGLVNQYETSHLFLPAEAKAPSASRCTVPQATCHIPNAFFAKCSETRAHAAPYVSVEHEQFHSRLSLSRCTAPASIRMTRQAVATFQ